MHEGCGEVKSRRGLPPTQHRSLACPLGPSPYSMVAWRPPLLLLLFLLALGRGLPSSAQLFLLL